MDEKLDIEGYFIIAEKSACLSADYIDDQFKKIVKQYITSDSTNIDEIFQSYLSKGKEDNVTLFGVSNIDFNTDEANYHRYEHWVTFCMFHSDNGPVLILLDYVTDDEYLNFNKTQLKEMILEVTNKENVEIEIIERQIQVTFQATEISRTLEHLKGIICILSQFEDKTEIINQFHSFQFSEDDLTIDFDQILVEVALSSKFRTKFALKKVVDSLKNVISVNPGLSLSQTNLINLSQALNNANFDPRQNDSIDFKEEIMNILKFFEDRGCSFDETVVTNISNYCTSNKSKYLSNIHETSLLLKENGDEKIQKSLRIFLENRVQLLLNIGKYQPEILSLEDLEEFFDVLIFNSDEKLILEQAELDKEFEKLELQTGELRQSEQLEEAVKSYNEWAAVSDALNQVKRQILFNKRMAEVSNDLHIKEILTLFGDLNFTDSYKLKIGVIEKIFEFCKVTVDEPVLIAVLKILKQVLVEAKISNFPCEILYLLKQENAKYFAELFVTHVLDINDTALEFLKNVLTDNEDDEIRNIAFEVLKEYRNTLPGDIKSFLELEESFLSGKSTTDLYLSHVKKGNKISYSSFKDISLFQNLDEIYNILKIIIKQDLQPIPAFCVISFKEFIKNLDINDFSKIVIKLCTLFLSASYIKLLDIVGLKNLIKLLDLSKDITKLLNTAFVKGEQISEEILKEIEDEVNENKNSLFNLLIMYKSEDFNNLKNPRKTHTERKQAIRNLSNSNSFFNSQMLRALELLIMYEPTLRDEAFKAIVNLLPDNYSSSFDFDLTNIIQHLYETDCVIPNLKTLIDKDNNIDFNDIIDYVYNRLLTDEHFEDAASLLQSLFEINKCKDILMKKANILLSVAFSVNKKKTRDVVIELIDKYLTIDEIAEFTTIENYQILRDVNNITSENILEHFEILESFSQQEFVLTENIIIMLMDVLGDTTLKEYHSRSATLLSQIQNQQKIPTEYVEMLFSKLFNNYEVINTTAVLKILENISWELPTSIIELALTELLIQTDEYVVNFILRVINANQTSLQEGAVFKIIEIILNETYNIDIKLEASDLLKRQNITFPSEEVLRNYFLLTTTVSDTSEKYSKLRCNLFRSLEETLRKGDQQVDYLQTFYNALLSVINNDADMFNSSNLEDFLSNESIDILDKFSVLSAMSNALFPAKSIDKTIFDDYPPEEWVKEISIQELLFSCYQFEDDFGVNEFKLEIFREKANELVAFINDLDDPNYTTCAVLQYVIDKQRSFLLNLDEIIELLSLLTITSESVAAFMSCYDSNAHVLYQLKDIFVRCMLNSSEIEYNDQELILLTEYLTFKSETIRNLFKNIKTGTSASELITFLIQISNSKLRKLDQEYFLNNLPKSSMTSWRMALYDKIIALMIRERFLEYKNYYSSYFTGVNLNGVFAKNAYNQGSEKYFYSANDINIISSEFLKEFVDFSFIKSVDFDTTPLVDILKTVLDSIERNNQPIFLNINTKTNHWISLVLITNEDGSYLALCVDPKGKTKSLDEIEAIENYLTEHNFIFKSNELCDQIEEHISGGFVLASMKLMALELQKNKEQFISNFESFKFNAQNEIQVLLATEFPKCYAQHICLPYKKQTVCDYHFKETETIIDLLKDTLHIDEDLIEASIEISEDESLQSNEYNYMYVIRIKEDADVNKESIIEALGCSEVFECADNVIRISEKFVNISGKIPKLDDINFSPTNNLIQVLLNQLGLENNEENTDTLLENLGIKDKEKSTEKITIGNNYSSLNSLHKKLTKLLMCGWSKKSIARIIERVCNEEDLVELVESLQPLCDYEIREYEVNKNGVDVMTIVTQTDLSNIKKKLHAIAISQTFQGTYNKKVDQLIQELKNLNQAANLNIFVDSSSLINQYEHVMRSFESNSIINPSKGTISDWNQRDITNWSIKVKSDPNSCSLFEKLAVIRQAVKLSNSYYPRDIQLLSALILINSEENMGRLVQINTGEGKTTIVAMLAIVKALHGHTVDIVTSSPELAKPQAVEMKDFYAMFMLSVAHNGSGPNDTLEPYKADIVYGAASNFQGDILRDEYSKLEIRFGRKCDVAIVDEVDSLLLDGKNHIVMLSTPMPAMDHLEPLLAAIWIQVGNVAASILEKDGEIFYIDRENALDEEGKIKPGIIDQAMRIETTKAEFIKNVTVIHARRMLRDYDNLPEASKSIPDDYPEIIIPNHLRELVTKVQVDKWVDSAIFAKFKCKLEKHYILSDAKIAPVDASNTGVVQANMHWSNGLHQFLQLKHGAKITSETLTTNFVSNVTYFRRYGKNIYGLTGTLGSVKSQELLCRVYNVDAAFIPPFKLKQYKELPAIISENDGAWKNEIVLSCLTKLEQGRGVLIITKYIEETESLSNLFQTKYHYPISKIKLYKTEKDSHVVSEKLKSGEMIIATNIAGRGTDIKPTDEIENNGGLHVCVTFLPPNERVEHQNIGRTSRTGNRGTGQFVLLANKFTEFETLRAERNKQEEDALASAEKEIKVVTQKDQVFFKFCNLLNEIEKQNKSPLGFLFLNKDILKILNKAIEERFGIWLKLRESEKIGEDSLEILDKFETFRSDIMTNTKNKGVVKNPFYYISMGNKYNESNQYSEAIDNFTRAINVNSYFTVNAFYNRAYARIAKYGADKKQHNDGEITRAVEDLNTVKKIIDENLLPMLGIIQKASESPALSEQVCHKINIFETQKNYIDKMLEVIDGAKEKNRGVEIETLDINEAIPQGDDITLYREEMIDFKTNGFVGNFKVTEIVPIDWGAFFSLLVIGLVQIVAGGLIAVFTLGAAASFGLGLISEGASDMITAVNDCIINKSFDWKSWGIQKAISMTVSIICAGLSAMKDVVKTAYQGVKAVVTGGIKSVTTVAHKAGMKLAVKAIATTVAKTVATQAVTKLIEYGIDKAIIPEIEKAIFNKVKGPLEGALLKNGNVAKMLEIDSINRNAANQRLILNFALQILQPNNEMGNEFLYITKEIAQGVLTNKVKGLDKVIIVKKALDSISELATFMPKFVAALNKKINEEADNLNIEKQLEKLQKRKENMINRVGKAEEEITESETRSVASDPERNDDDINLKDIDVPEKQIELEKIDVSTDFVCSKMAENVSSQMTNIVNTGLVKPAVNESVSYGMSKITAKMDQSLQQSIGDYQAERRIAFSQDIEHSKRIPKEFSKGSDDIVAIQKADEMISDLEAGGQAGLPHLGALSKEVNRPIKVLNEDGKHIRTINQEKGVEPVEIQYHKPTVDNPSGHWTLPNNKEPPFNNNQKNDCLFNVIAAQTNRDPRDLRYNTALEMSNNRLSIANQSRDIMRLEVYKTNILQIGGAKFKCNKKKDANEYLKESQGSEAYVGPNDAYASIGHALGHTAGNETHNVHYFSENTNENKGKSAFLKSDDQRDVLYYASKNKKCKQAMDYLNGSNSSRDPRKKAIVVISGEELKAHGLAKLPMVGTWEKGALNKSSKREMTNILIVFQHHKGQERNIKAPAQILTMYPIEREKNGKFSFEKEKISKESLKNKNKGSNNVRDYKQVNREVSKYFYNRVNPNDK